jgi:hypothetical protein
VDGYSARTVALHWLNATVPSIEVDDACTKAPLPDFFVSIE